MAPRQQADERLFSHSLLFLAHFKSRFPANAFYDGKEIAAASPSSARYCEKRAPCTTTAAVSLHDASDMFSARARDVAYFDSLPTVAEGLQPEIDWGRSRDIDATAPCADLSPYHFFAPAPR